MKLVNWQCHFTEHQYHTWGALQQLLAHPIHYVVANLTSDSRQKQGWTILDLSKLEVTYLKQMGWWQQGVQLLKNYPDAVHIFGGFWADRRFFPLLVYAVARGIKVVVMNESYATEAVGYMSNSSRLLNRLKVLLRPRLYRLTAVLLKALSKPHQICLLAISVRARDQFERAGFKSRQVFAFGYFVPRLSGVVPATGRDESKVRLVFVGSLLETKGVDLAVEAVERLAQSGMKICLDVYGNGKAENYISPFSTCVAFKGAIPFGEAQRFIAEYDALILPSRHDGWGVVVNEALLQGVPAIVSDHVGAKCLVESTGAGLVFQSNDVDSLVAVLGKFAASQPLRQIMREKAKIAGDDLTPEKAAGYMKNALEYFFYENGQKPEGVWCGQS